MLSCYLCPVIVLKGQSNDQGTLRAYNGRFVVKLSTPVRDIPTKRHVPEGGEGQTYVRPNQSRTRY